MCTCLAFFCIFQCILLFPAFSNSTSIQRACLALSRIFQHVQFYHFCIFLHVLSFSSIFLHVWHFLIFLARLSFWVLLRLARTNNLSFQHFEPKCTWVDGTDIFDQLDYRITFILLISCFHIKGRYHYVVNCPTR